MKKLTQSQSRAVDSENLLSQSLYLATLVEAFLIDRKAQNLSSKTLRFYRLNTVFMAGTQSIKGLSKAE